MKRFWDKVDVKGPDDCWEWQAFKNEQGYGRFYFNGRLHGAHRVAYQLTYRDFDQSLDCCHKCDNPSCVNPEHLFLGTEKDNIDDMMKKGRHHFKSRTHCSKGHEYTEENILWERGGTKRTCRVCHNERSKISMRKHWARRKEQECQK
jgi:hypothetical protein